MAILELLEITTVNAVLESDLNVKLEITAENSTSVRVRVSVGLGRKSLKPITLPH